MGRYEVKNPLTSEGRNQINSMFEELYKEYIGAGNNAKDAREKAVQAVADSILAKDIAETTRQEMLAIIREQTKNGDLAPEIAQSRGGKQTLGERLYSIDSQLAQTQYDLEGRGVNLQTLGAVGDGVSDVSDILINALSTYQDVFIPPGFYGISKEIVLNNRRRLKGVGGSWSPRQESDTVFVWIGEEKPDGAMFRISHAPVGVEPTTAITNVYFKNVVLDGRGKIGYGYYAAYISDESKIKNITVKNTLKHGGRTEKAWYASIEDITAKNNKGCGITIGREPWGECNSLKINNLRAHSCGEDETYNFDNNREWGYGVGLYNGYNLIIDGLTSEKNIGAGVVMKNSKSVSGIRRAYLEDNERLSSNSKRRSIIYVADRNGRGHFIEDVHLHGEVTQPVRDGIVLIGENPFTPIEVNNIHFGWFQSEFDNYKLVNCYYGITDYVTGNIGKSVGVYGYNLTTLYVRESGNDNNDGRTPSTAFATMNKALQTAKYAERVTTIDCTGLNISETTIDFSGVNKHITLLGGGTTKVNNETNNQGLEIINARYGLHLKNFETISRILPKNSVIKVEGAKLELSDNGAFGVVYAIDSNVRLISCQLSSNTNTNMTMTGITAINSMITMENTTFGVFTTGRYIQLRDGSYILADSWLRAFEDGYITIDDAGYVMGGAKIKNKSGSITFS